MDGQQYSRNAELKPGMLFPEGMHRIALGVEYLGSAYQGFQKQQTAPNTVQAELEAAISSVANEPVTLVCAGRTDAGVHASGQVIHFDTLSLRPAKAWVQGVNTHLPDDIRIHWSLDTGPTFHARFSAVSRTYRFVFSSSPVRSAVMQKMVTWTGYPLDARLMNDAVQRLLGEHDFSAFRAAQCQAHSPVRELQAAKVVEVGQFVVLEVRANAFLHHMVRNIAGSLQLVGRGLRPVDWLDELLAGRDRTLAAPTAHPHGLFLTRVEYPQGFGIPSLSMGPAFLPEVI